MAGAALGKTQARRHEVGLLWLKGYSLREIQSHIQKNRKLAHTEKTTLTTIFKDVKAIKDELMERNIDVLELKRAETVESLRMIKARAWEEISKYPINRDGSLPSLLNVIASCDEKIAKLEGTFAPIEVTGKGGKDLVPVQPSVFLLPEGGIFTPPDGNGHKEEPIPEEG